MLSEQAQIETFDRVFDRVFRGAVDVPGVTRNPDVPPIRRRPSPAAPRPPTATRVLPAVGVPAAGPPGSTPSDDDDVPSTAAASTEERLRTTPFDACTPAELEQLRALMDDLALDPPQRRSRRHRRAVRGQAIDLRQSLRAARHTGGDPLRLVRRRRRTRQRRVVLIADVSGSMEAYGRAYLYLLHGAVRALRAEAFVFATRLHRLTRQLRTTQPAVALAAAMAATPDWSGGTRLGDAIKAFNDGWARRGLARGAVVVIVSDGWEGGDPAVLGREMERLARLAHRIVWVNPRLQSPQFRPLTGGMAAALPHVDDVVSGHDLDELEHVLEAIRAPRGTSVTGRGTPRRRAGATIEG